MKTALKKSPKPASRDVLPADIIRQLLLASPAQAPVPARAAAIRQNLLARVSNKQSDPFVTVAAQSDGFVPLAPLIETKVLSSDGKYFSILLRMQPGAALPAHSHGDDEECVVLEGEAYLGGTRVRAGDYHLARKGSDHGVVRSDTGALLFLRTTVNMSRYMQR